MVRDPQAALAFAAEGKGVAVLAVNTDDSWWVGLRRDWSSLSVFDGFGPAGGQPTSLAVGKIDPAALPKGRASSSRRAGTPATAAARGAGA